MEDREISSVSKSLSEQCEDLKEDEHVMSEIHLGCPPGHSGPHISYFTFFIPNDIFEIEKSKCNDISEVEAASPNQWVELDEDGDLVLPRRSKLCMQSYTMAIQHNITSSIPSVGLQVWKAELSLADFVLHKMFTSSEFHGTVALELGAGTGLAGLLLARVAKTVFLTDHGNEILNNCANNVKLNSELFNGRDTVHVRELDWTKPWPPRISLEESALSNRHSWTSSEVEEAQEASLLLAADVIYNDDLTDAFFSTIERLMCLDSEKVLYLALEKRYNFSMDDLNVVANGYSHFLSYLQDGECEDEDLEFHSKPCYVGKRMDIATIPQYLSEYDRGFFSFSLEFLLVIEGGAEHMKQIRNSSTTTTFRTPFLYPHLIITNMASHQRTTP